MPDEEPQKLVAEKCRQFLAKLKELLEHTRLNKPPQVLRTWVDEVDAWMQSSRLAFPEYQSADQARKAKRQNATTRFEQLLNASDRQRLATLGEHTVGDDGRFWLSATYKKLSELACGWAPMTLQLLFDRNAKKLEFRDLDKSRVLDAMRRFTADIHLLQARAMEHAKNLDFELLEKGVWVTANELADDRLLSTVKELTIQVCFPRPSDEDVVATLELDCAWDVEHGVRFGLLSNNQIVLQP